MSLAAWLGELLWSPDFLIGASSILSLTPSASVVNVIATLPLLIYNAEQGDYTLKHFGRHVAAIATGSTAGSLFTTWDLLPAPAEVIASQALFSAINALMVGLLVALQAYLRRVLGRPHGDWLSSAVFGLLWGFGWHLWSSLSPFGRYGVPTPEDLTLFEQAVGWIGPTGLDILTGMTGHLIAQTYRGIQDPRPLIEGIGAAEEDEDDNTPPNIEEGNGRRSSHTAITERSELRRSATRTYGAAGSRETSPVRGGDTPVGRSWPKKLTISTAGVLGLMASLPKPTVPALSDPVAKMSPFAVACALPPTPQATLEEAIHSMLYFGNRANLIVLPETTLTLRFEGERTFALETIHRRVSEQYGVHALVTMDSGGGESRAVNEVVLVSPEAIEGTYIKKNLFPLVESHKFAVGKYDPPVWTVNMSHPHGITKPEWSSVPPFVRPVHVTPLICLDTLHPQLVKAQDPLPSILIVPASANPSLADQVIQHTRVLSASHRIPSLVCSHGRSAAIDEYGRVIHEATGGKGFVAKFALPWYGDGQSRDRTYWEKLGAGKVLSITLLAVLIAKITEKYRSGGTRSLIDAAEQGVGKLLKAAQDTESLLPAWDDSEEGDHALEEVNDEQRRGERNERHGGLRVMTPDNYKHLISILGHRPPLQ